MAQIIVKIDPSGVEGTDCGLLRTPIDLPDPHRSWPVQFDDLLGLNGPDVVRQIGERLAERIRENANVRFVLEYALARPAQSPSLPICFRVGDAVAHALCWEALVGNHSFMALDPRWPIVRIARGGTLEIGARLPYEAPLKFAAVLSAVRSRAIEEWNGLYAAVKDARALGLAIRMTVFAGEEAVINAVSEVDDDQVEGLPVPNTASALIDALHRLEPQLLHLYCHGSIVNEVRRLEIGTVRDFDRDDGTSSVVLSVDELGQEMADAGAWAVVLNACRGAEASGESLTHAEQVVNKGVPVAVGMRRVVDADDACAFSAAFYPAVFAAIARAVSAPDGPDRTLEWADTLVRARRVLRDKHGADPALHDAWTLPVLYTREGSFKLIVVGAGGAAATTHAIAESETVGGAVDTLADSAPAGVLEDLAGLMPRSL